MQVLYNVINRRQQTMSTPHHHEKVRVVIECSEDERAYIKMLAAQSI